MKNITNDGDNQRQTQEKKEEKIILILINLFRLHSNDLEFSWLFITIKLNLMIYYMKNLIYRSLDGIKINVQFNDLLDSIQRIVRLDSMICSVKFNDLLD